MHLSVRNLMKFPAFTTLLLSLTASNMTLAQEPTNTAAETDITQELTILDNQEIGPAEPEIETQQIPFAPQVRYVSDEFFVPLRETPCPRCKIVHWGIKSGVRVDLLDLRDGWGLVSTAKGYKGWMEEQFISESPSGRQQLVGSEAKLDVSRARVKQLEETIQKFQSDLEILQQANEQLDVDNKRLARGFSEMEGISADPAALNQQNQTLVKQNHLLQSDNDVLKAEVEILENDRSNQFFLYGALTVFLAALLVAFIPKLRGKKRLSEWG